MWQQRSASLAVFVLALCLAPSVLADADEAPQQPPAGLSHARVVSLSLVEGTVITRKPGSEKWVSATLSAPIEEGTFLATAKNSFAEVQFENGSTVRIGELS